MAFPSQKVTGLPHGKIIATLKGSWSSKKKGQLSIELTLFVHENSLTNLVWKLGRRIGSEHGTVGCSPVCVCGQLATLIYPDYTEDTQCILWYTHTYTAYVTNQLNSTYNNPADALCRHTHTHTAQKRKKILLLHTLSELGYTPPQLQQQDGQNGKLFSCCLTRLNNLRFLQVELDVTSIWIPGSN
jgi:hypothetical protein